MGKKFKAGQKVKVVDSSKCFSTYTEMADHHGLKNFGGTSNGEEGIVIVVTKHLAGYYKEDLLCVRTDSGKEFIISCEGVELVEDVLPDKMIISCDPYTWECTRVDNGMYKLVVISECRITGHGVGSYPEEEIRKWLKEGTYKLVSEEVSNGVNGNGEPMNFTVEMLKPFMRVETENGTMYIIVPDGEDGVSMVREYHYHQTAAIAEDGEENAYKAIKIYKAPSDAWHMIDPKQHGALIWEYKSSADKAAEESLKIRKAYLQKQIEEVQENLASLEKEMQSLGGS